MSLNCPDCNTTIPQTVLDDLNPGDIFDCTECDVELVRTRSGVAYAEDPEFAENKDENEEDMIEEEEDF
jgi:hypothetical protein